MAEITTLKTFARKLAKPKDQKKAHWGKKKVHISHYPPYSPNLVTTKQLKAHPKEPFQKCSQSWYQRTFKKKKLIYFCGKIKQQKEMF